MRLGNKNPTLKNQFKSLWNQIWLKWLIAFQNILRKKKDLISKLMKIKKNSLILFNLQV